VKPHPILRGVLWPLSLLYGGVALSRARLYRSGIRSVRRLGGVVISVGNLTVGGTGKTPMVLWLAGRLMAEGKRPGILLRGYSGFGRRSRGGEESDEARLLASRLGPGVVVAAGKDRWAQGKQLEQQGIEWFVLDDGFQHLQLARDVDIVLVDATNPFGGGLLPAGRRREPRSALARADIVVITRTQHSPAVEALVRYHTRASVFFAWTEFKGFLPLGANPASAAISPADKISFFAFCGIGNPQGFCDDLRRWGFHLAGHRAFRDHHVYSEQDLRRIEQAAHAAGAQALVCTEKDSFNLPPSGFREMPVGYCRMGLRLNDPEAFWREVLATVNRRRGKGA
jgi:tetraacyldisaccharide 4'-kinase